MEILGPGQPRILDRKTAVHVSTHPSEVVTCELEDGTTCRLLLKYSGFERESFGHKGGVPYEGLVYRDVVSRIGLPSVKWFGNYHEVLSGRSWLALEFVENARRISKSMTPLHEAATWIGRFHDAAKTFPSTPDLILYDADYYASWARRTLALGENYASTPAWLGDLCRVYESAAEELAAWQPTIVHGEYYAKNILVIDDVVCPIDWESAAVGQGEVDLASLTEFWKPETVAECEKAYVAGRWPEGEPAEFRRMLGLARMYIHFRWLSVVKEWEASGTSARLSRAKAEADNIGLL
jgi:hypothetical protein